MRATMAGLPVIMVMKKQKYYIIYNIAAIAILHDIYIFQYTDMYHYDYSNIIYYNNTIML